MAHVGVVGGWLPLLCWCCIADSLSRQLFWRPQPWQRIDRVQVGREESDPERASVDLPLIACATMARNHESAKR